MKVILATHSPTTVALSPEESIFVISKEEGKTTIQKQDKQDAVNLLSDGFITLDKGLQLLDQVAQQRLNIFTEGNNIEYIEKAINLLAPELNARIQIVDSIKDRSGEKQLNVLYNFFTKLNHTNSVLFVYDCDVNKNDPEANNTFYYVLPKNDSNTRIRRGIENMLPESLILDEHYDEDTRTNDTGNITITKNINKTKFCRHILENGKTEDFKKFDGLIDKIRSILAIQAN